MADVFVSYAREDRAQVARLAAALDQTGLSVWWDRRLVGGDAFAEEIERELEGAGAVIVAWSNAGSRSRWVRDEAEFAAQAGKLVCVSIDGSLPPLGFRQFHAIDISRWQGDADLANELVRAVRLRMQGTPAELRQSAAAPAPGPPAGGSSVLAVLPFANRSALAEDAFFADAVHDELLTQIARLSSMQVISRTSVMRFRDTLQPIPEIARQLGAMAVVEGSVQRAGSRVRINVQLVDGTRDTHLWAENFDRELTPDNVFDIQTEITRSIATQLHARLSGSDQAALDKPAPTQSLAAYDWYLRGQLLVRSEAAGEGEIRAAIDAFDHALAADPDFAEALAGKARAQLCLYWFYGWDPAWVERARSAVERARKLAPEAIDTLLAVAYFHYWGELDYAAAETALNRILAQAPNNAEALACKAYVVRRDGRFSEALMLLEQARRLDPMLIDLSLELAFTLTAFGRFDEARRLDAKIRTLDAHSAFTAVNAGDIGYLQGRADLAWQGASIEVTEPDFAFCYRRAWHAINTRDEALIGQALSDWPAELRRTAHFPLTWEIYQAMAARVLGQRDHEQTLLDALQARIRTMDSPYPGGWKPDAPYFPVTVPGLLGDADAVHAAVAEYRQNAVPDAFGILNPYHAIAAALAQAGDHAGALDYLERLADTFGPNAWLPMSITPAYDSLRDQARFQRLQTNCSAWLASQPAES